MTISNSVRISLTLLLLTFAFSISSALAAQTTSEIDSTPIDVKLPDGLHVKGQLRGAFIVKGSLYFQMSLSELFVEGFTDRQTGQYHYYKQLTDRFGAEIPPSKLTQGRFKVDIVVRSFFSGSMCNPTYWRITHDLNVNLARKTKKG